MRLQEINFFNKKKSGWPLSAIKFHYKIENLETQIRNKGKAYEKKNLEAQLKEKRMHRIKRENPLVIQGCALDTLGAMETSLSYSTSSRSPEACRASNLAFISV